MTKIFFGCSMRGGFQNVSQEDLRNIVASIESLGHTLMSKHQTSINFTAEESPYSAQEIHDRDYHWLEGAELGVFEISNPSLGAGGEISDMTHMQKPVLCIYKKEVEPVVSAYIVGKANSPHIKSKFVCQSYESLEEAKRVIQKFINSCEQ